MFQACHMKAVHVAQNFQCHLCAKAFKAAHALKDHIATHTGEKMYKYGGPTINLLFQSVKSSFFSTDVHTAPNRLSGVRICIATRRKRTQKNGKQRKLF